MHKIRFISIERNIGFVILWNVIEKHHMNNWNSGKCVFVELVIAFIVETIRTIEFLIVFREFFTTCWLTILNFKREFSIRFKILPTAPTFFIFSWPLYGQLIPKLES